MAEKLKAKPSNGASPSILSRIDAIPLRYRQLANFLVHAILFAAALLLAYSIRMDAGIPGASRYNWFEESFLPWLPFFVVVKLLVFWRMRLLRGGWQYASIRDVANILHASFYFVAVTFALVVLFRYLPIYMELQTSGIIHFYFGDVHSSGAYSNGVLLLDFLVTVFLISALRMGYRIYREELRPVSAEGVRRVLIVGAGNAAEAIVREILRMRVDRYRVVGLLDDDPKKRDLELHGIRVLGTTSDIATVCQEQKVEEIIIAMPSATQKQLRRVIDRCSGTKLKFQSLPGVGDLIEGRVAISQMRPVDINDLLGRQAVQLDTDAVARFLNGRRVLITGAGGSIGSEMCRQIARFGPAAMILVEQAETPLFDIENELRASYPSIPIIPCICDIYDRQRVTKVWTEHRPEIVIHAAAHKHVPLMEHNPGEALKNNILGTRNVADISCQTGVGEFVMISTDKAVHPSSVMGASKRAAEIYTQSLNGRPGCRTQFKAVRFGNVLGSAGSVVPTFRKQIAAGGPVRVTHPEMTRYFMTIPEASQLVLQAAATGCGGQIFLLDMGEPVKIVDLARQMITLSGFRPDEDIEIQFSGIRPGEKLFEELRTEGEDIEPTIHPKVMIWMCRPTDWDTVQRSMAEFTSLTECTEPAKIIAAIQRLVPEFKPLNPIVSGPVTSASPAAPETQPGGQPRTPRAAVS